MSLKDLTVDKTVDIHGKICPYTLIETRDAVKTLASGQLLEVLVDHPPAATETIPNFCRKKGYPYEVIDLGDKLFRVLIQKEE
jgi:tRNA 2-thiouridine synthesizing protein A